MQARNERFGRFYLFFGPAGRKTCSRTRSTLLTLNTTRQYQKPHNPFYTNTYRPDPQRGRHHATHRQS